MSWYDGLFCQVKWGDKNSNWFVVTAGVCQGGVLSPNFYCIYVEDLLDALKRQKKGCYYLNIFAAAFIYADDMAVIAPSIKGLVSLLKTCESYCAEWDICLNAKKSRCMYFGKRINIQHNIILNGNAVEWTNKWPYLGVKLNSSKSFNCSVKEKVRKFYRSVNAILRIDGRSNDMVMLALLEAHCVPILTYGIEVIHVQNADERRQLQGAYNSIV